MTSANERLQASPFYEQVKARIQALQQFVRNLYQDGKISWADAQALIRRVIKDASGIVADIDASDEDRRQMFIDICVCTWEDVGEPLKLVPDLALVPDWIENGLEEKVIDPMLHNLVEFSAAVAYDYVAGR